MKFTELIKSDHQIITELDKIHDTDGDEFIFAKMNSKIYAIAIDHILEIIEPTSPDPIANSKPCYLGIINYHNQVIGVIDLRVSSKKDPMNSFAYIVVQTNTGIMALAVDYVMSMHSLSPSIFDREVSLRSEIDQSYLLGFTKVDNQLITLLDIKSVLEMHQINDLSKIEKSIEQVVM